MIDLKELREDVMYGSMSIEPALAAELLDMLEDSQQDALRYRWIVDNPEVRIVLFKGKYRAQYGHTILTGCMDSHDEAIDAAMQS